MESPSPKLLENQSSFLTNIKCVYGHAGETWLEQLPSHLENLSRQWDFTFIKTIPNLSFSFVALVKFNSNQQAVILKTAPDNERIDTEYHWLSSFNSIVPRILKYDLEKNAFLMEYLTPGNPLTTLVQTGQDEIATQVICQMINQLQSNQRQLDFNFKPIIELAQDLKHLKGHIKNYSLSKAESLFIDLSTDCSQPMLLHGDLHHDNILKHEDTWKVIDPHGYLGDPIAEVGVMIRNPQDCFPQHRPLKIILESRLKVLSEMLPFDKQKIQAWAFCMTLLSAAWNIQDYNTIAEREIEIASIIENIRP